MENVAFRLSPDDRDEIDEIAWRNRTSRSEVLRTLAENFVADEDLQEQILDSIDGTEELVREADA